MEAAQITGDQIGSGLWLISSSCQANKFVSRTASKPLASRFQSYVLAHPKLRPAVLRFAQVTHIIVTGWKNDNQASAAKSSCNTSRL